MRRLVTAIHFAILCTLPGCTQHVETPLPPFNVDDFSTVEKIDVHFHLHHASTEFMASAAQEQFSILNITTQSGAPEIMRQRHDASFLQYRNHPDRVAPITCFSMDDFDEDDWQERTIRFLDEHFEKGAVGVKIWKNVGMVDRNKEGKLIMVDDPRLDPIIDHIQKRSMVIVGHLGEPKNCWLPLEQMTTNNDRSYFQENPEFHMYLHPELPSYQDQIDARDRMLAKHPKLRFIGAHLASLEWSVDEMANFLDRFPNAYLDTAARLGQLQYQSQRERQKVIAFLTKYQDRILYGSDMGVEPDETSITERYEKTKMTWLRDWKYFNTVEMIEVYELDDPVKGLALPRNVVEKIYRTNAQKLFPQSWRPSTP